MVVKIIIIISEILQDQKNHLTDLKTAKMNKYKTQHNTKEIEREILSTYFYGI